jgi:hypothetical protein
MINGGRYFGRQELSDLENPFSYFEGREVGD